ncbi:MAG: MoaD/ThiS family protein [Ardenticatenaceae bacterium]|nr:MoaD/ThiS family protein [Anaerolineales bacterium]MCB8982847.1 MoaD/ThiS family protein [Ardenticatenaceae bacterium]
MLQQYKPKTAGGAPHHPFSFALEAGDTAVSLAARLDIPPGMVTAVAVNQTAVPLTTPLRPGDQISLFPPSVGGSSPR